MNFDAITVKSILFILFTQVFCNIIDMAGINSHVLYEEVTGTKISRSFCFN